MVIPAIPHSIQQGEMQAQQKIVELLLEHTSELFVNIRREIETVNVSIHIIIHYLFNLWIISNEFFINRLME